MERDLLFKKEVKPSTVDSGCKVHENDKRIGTCIGYAVGRECKLFGKKGITSQQNCNGLSKLDPKPSSLIYYN